MREARTVHVEEVAQVAAGAVVDRDLVIRDSWQRCLSAYRLDPSVLREPHIHTASRLRERKEAMDSFLHVARVGVESLYRQVTGLGYVLLLTDAQGVTVDFIGDPSNDAELRRAGLYGGADWNEVLAGTCGVGTCIATGKALTVHQTDHFDARNIALTCTAAPIFAPDGNLAAVLDISAMRSPEPKLSQHLALQLVTSYAQKIENANLLNAFRNQWIFQLSRSQEFVDVDPEYWMAIDAGGRILGYNNAARELISAEFALAERSARIHPLRRPASSGAAFRDLFDADFSDLPNFTRVRPAGQRGVTLRASGMTLFALAQRPPEAAAPSRARMAAVSPDGPLAAISGGDPQMDEVVRRAARIVNSGLSILVQGPTGTGKEHLVKALHKSGLRAEKPFVAVNCAALPEHLIEAELFGYEAGSFTGAAARGKKGLILEANGGTLFLDEIGDMPLLAQTRLLRVLSEREIMPVGRTKPVPVDLRVIAATHCDLQMLIKTGRFREDLYFRLNGATLTLPPLRMRADLDWLIDRILAQKSGEAGCFRLSPEARAALRAHSWPGNVRELCNAIDYAIAVAGDVEIDRQDLPDSVSGPSAAAPAVSAVPEKVSGFVCEPMDLRGEELLAALRARQWNISAAARDLGVDRSTIHRQMHRYAIKSPKHWAG